MILLWALLCLFRKISEEGFKPIFSIKMLRKMSYMLCFLT